MPLISIVIPVYGAEAFLPRCLDSVLAQTFPDWECILVEDGSPDHSGAICDRYAANDPRFRVIHQQNQGSSAAINNGMQLMQGQYMVLLDNDDAFAPTLLEDALASQQQHPEDLVLWSYSYGAITWREGPAHFNPLDRSQVVELYLASWLMVAWNKFYSVPFLRQLGLQYTVGGCYGADTQFTMEYIIQWLRAHPKGNFLFSDRPLHMYECENPNSETANLGKGYCRDELLLTARALDWFTHDFETSPENWKLLCSSLLKTMAGAIYVENRSCGPKAAKKALEDPAVAALSAKAKELHCRTPIVRALAGRHLGATVRLGRLVMEGSSQTYLRLCRIWELLHL